MRLRRAHGHERLQHPSSPPSPLRGEGKVEGGDFRSNDKALRWPTQMPAGHSSDVRRTKLDRHESHHCGVSCWNGARHNAE